MGKWQMANGNALPRYTIVTIPTGEAVIGTVSAGGSHRYGAAQGAAVFASTRVDCDWALAGADGNG